MSARVFTRAEWHAARHRLAQQGKAPRLALTRGICLCQSKQGAWFVGIYERRFGIWRQPHWLCRPTTLEQARAAALRAWRQYRLPLFWSYAGERSFRPYHAGLSEPQAVCA